MERVGWKIKIIKAIKATKAAAFLDRKEEKKMDEDLALTTEQLEELSNNKAEKVEE